MAEKEAGSFKLTRNVAKSERVLVADTDLFETQDGQVVTDQNDPRAHILVARAGMPINPATAERLGLKEGTGKAAGAGKVAGEVVQSEAADAEPARTARTAAAPAPAPAAPASGPETERRGGSVTITKAPEK